MDTVIIGSENEDGSLDWERNGWVGRIYPADVPVGFWYLRCRKGSRIIAMQKPISYEQVHTFDPEKHWANR